MKYSQLLFLSLVLSLSACQEEAPSNPEATLFSPETISSKLPEFATTVNAEEDLLFFNRTAADRSEMRILYSQRVGDFWPEPDSLPFSTGAYLDVDPFLTADGRRLYFSSTRPVDSTDAGGTFHTWYVDRVGESWSEPINPGYPLNSDSTEIFISLTKAGNAYFVSERDGYRGILLSKFENGRHQEAERVELRLRGEPIYASNPCIASDESFLIVAVRDPEGKGTPDLFVSWRQNGSWSELINLGDKVNSDYAEFAPGLTKDNQTLYFTSERPGVLPEQGEGIRPPGDIYQVNIGALLPTLRENQ